VIATQNRHRNLTIAIGVVAIALRLIGLNQPFIDEWSWRQTDVAAIARNYFQNGFHFAWPQIDWAGDQPGYVGTEFPILPFLAASCYTILGVHEWIGRSQAIILFAASLPFFFLLVRDVLGAATASWALFFYSFAPLNFFAGREFMPDVPSLSLALIGLYFFRRWVEAERSTPLIGSAALISLSILIKAPSAIIGAPLACLALQRYGISAARRIELWIFALIALLPSAIWYWHAHAIAEKFYPHHFFGAGGFQIMNVRWYGEIAAQIATSSLTPVLFASAGVGIFVTRSNKQAQFFQWWLAAMIVFIIVAGYGNRHQWYQLPLVPIAAAFAGASCACLAAKISRWRTKIVLSILLVGSFATCALYYVRPLYRPSAAELRDTGLELKIRTPPNSLIIAAESGDPTIFYYAERKGWHFLEKDGIYNGHPATSADAIADLESLRKRGATHIVFYSATFWWLEYYKQFADHLNQTAVAIETMPQFKIYKLNPP
jgi:4-amino-4-deoxy-L-arabinose transferase-like glycosyltransferase